MAKKPAKKSDAEAAEQPKFKSTVLAQFVRDLSFENVLAQKGIEGEVKPDVKVDIKLDARKRKPDNQYEVITKVNVTSKTKESGQTLFVAELEYSGIFEVEGIPEDQLHPYLLIECPRVTFPFVRRIISDITRDSGFPALNLDLVDFVALYRAELERQVAAKKSEDK